MIDITYYTDPLCCWSWAFEPQWRKLLYAFDGQIKYRYCMGGLLPGWKHYNDSVNSVSKPIQMGPVWMHAKQLSGMPMQHNIWIQNPPASSYPACIAVKCAALQSAAAEEAYLRAAREAVMISSENIADNDVLVALAATTAAQIPGFDVDRFKKDLKDENGFDSFRKDLQETKYYNINRFPTLVVKGDKNRAVIISGYRPYDQVIEAISKLSDLKKTHDPIVVEEYKARWNSLTARELEEVG